MPTSRAVAPWRWKTAKSCPSTSVRTGSAAWKRMALGFGGDRIPKNPLEEWRWKRRHLLRENAFCETALGSKSQTNAEIVS